MLPEQLQWPNQHRLAISPSLGIGAATAATLIEMRAAKIPAKEPTVAPKKGPKPAPAPTHVQHVAFELLEAPASPTREESEATSASQNAMGDATPYGIIVEDDAPAGNGQMHRSAFMDQMASSIENTANALLQAAGKTAKDCPYLEHWLRFYRDRSAAKIEKAIQHYAHPEGRDLASVEQAVLDRVQAAVTAWTATRGNVTQIPPGIDPMGTTDQLPDLQPSQSPPLTSDHPPSNSTDDPAALLDALGPGDTLSGPTLDRMQSGFGQDLSSVRIHNDSNAAALATENQAKAFTVGQHIAFAPSQYKPGTLGGDALLAHEVAHTIQQRNAQAPSRSSTTADSGLEDSANQAAVGAMLASPQPAGSAGGLKLQRCGPGVPEQTKNWQDVNRNEYDAAVAEIRSLHEEEMKLLDTPGWDQKRVDQLAVIQDGLREQVAKLQDMGIRRDAPTILKLLLQDAPQDLRKVTGSLEAGSGPLYWGEPRAVQLNLDYLPPKVDWWIQWDFKPSRADSNPMAMPGKPNKKLATTLDGGFWASWDRFGGSSDPEEFHTKAPEISIVARLFLGSQQEPAGVFATPVMKIKNEVPPAFTIDSPQLLNIPIAGAAAAQPNQPPPTTSYAMQGSDVDFTLSWSPQLGFNSQPKYGIIWWVKEPGATAHDERRDLQLWTINLHPGKLGEYAVGAKIYGGDPDLVDKPLVESSRTFQCVTHEDLGKKALAQAEQANANANYHDYIGDLDKQIADTEETAKAGTVAPRLMGEHLSQLKEQRKKVGDQVGSKDALPFPATDSGFEDGGVYVTNLPAVLSAPEYRGAFPLSVFLTMRRNGSTYNARITDATTQDVIGWTGSGGDALTAVNNAISDWHNSNEYPQGGSLHYSVRACGWNLRDSFGTSTFKKEFWKWFDRIIFIASAITAIVLILLPDPTGITKGVGLALLGVGIIRSALAIYSNLSLGRPILDQRNVLEAINIVASLIGLKGGMMMSSAGKGVALGEPLVGSALTTFKIGKGLVAMTAAIDVGTFVYIAGDAMSQLAAAANDPNLTESQRQNLVFDTFLRLVAQGGLMIGTNAHLFQGVKPRGTNLGLFLDKVAGTNGEIKLDPSMRARLVSEFRKINPEADVSSISDRDLVMGLHAIRTRAQVVQNLADTRNSLDAKGKAAFDRKRLEFKSPEEFQEAIDAAGGNPKDYFAKLAADPDFMAKKVGPDLPYAEQMQRIRAADPSSRVELAPSQSILVHDAGIDIAPDNQLRINGQIDIHPAALKNLTDAELKTLLDTTRQIKQAGGKPTKEQLDALKNFTASGGYRYRFEFQRQDAMQQVQELGLATHPLFQNIPQEGQNRLIELKAEGNISGAKNLRKQATNWALSQNPRSVREFVDLFQYYAENFKDRIKAQETAFDAAVAKRMTGPPAMKKDPAASAVAKDMGITGKRGEYFAGQVEREMGDAANLEKVSDTVRADVTAAYQKSISDPAAAIGKTKIDPTLPRDQMVAKVKDEGGTLTFGSPSEIAYHSEKHYGKDVPVESGAASEKVKAYMDSARNTIANPTKTESRTTQNGGTIITFTRDVPTPGGGSKPATAFVYVTTDGNVSILTYYAK